MARRKKETIHWGNLEPGGLIKIADIKILVCIILYNTKKAFSAETITHIIRYNSIATYFDPYTVRESALDAANYEILLQQRLKDNSIEIVEDDDKFVVKISMLENGKELMGFSMRVGSLDEANKVKHNFLDDPNGFYTMNFRKLFGINQEE